MIETYFTWQNLNRFEDSNLSIFSPTFQPIQTKDFVFHQNLEEIFREFFEVLLSNPTGKREDLKGGKD